MAKIKNKLVFPADLKQVSKRTEKDGNKTITITVYKPEGKEV